MAKTIRKKATTDDLLRDMMIVQLGLAGIGQRDIREIVGVDLNHVTEIVKHLKRGKANDRGK